MVDLNRLFVIHSNARQNDSDNTNAQNQLNQSIRFIFHRWRHSSVTYMLFDRWYFDSSIFLWPQRFYFIWHFTFWIKTLFVCVTKWRIFSFVGLVCVDRFESGSHNRVKCFHLNKVFTAGDALCVILRCAKSKTAANWKIVRTQCATAKCKVGWYRFGFRFYLACLYLPEMSSYIFLRAMLHDGKLWHLLCITSIRKLFNRIPFVLAYYAN